MDKTNLSSDQLAALDQLGKLGAFRDKTKRNLNEKKIEQACLDNPSVKRFREQFKRKFKKDFMDDKQFPVKESNFSWQKMREQIELREADSESTFVQFLRAGIQNITIGAYKAVETSFEDWVTVVNSNRREELYAPNHGVSFPREIGQQEVYPQVGAAALDIKLQNKKYGSMYAVEWELLEDDQTGSFAMQSALLGEYLKLLTEVLVYAKLASVPVGTAVMQYINLVIPPSETQPSYESNYPWTLSSAPFRGGGYNKATPGTLNQANVQAGIIALMAQKNLQGIKMQVNAKRLLISPYHMFDAAILLNSSYYPSGTNAAGVVGGPFSVNPLGPDSPWKTVTQITVSRYMFDTTGSPNGNSLAWYLVDDTKPWFVVQYREPVTVIQENPESGESFDRDVVRFKARSRQNADFLDPRFAWQGSDGTA